MSLVVEGSQTLLRCALSSADLADSSWKCFLQYVLSLGPFRGMTQIFLLLHVLCEHRFQSCNSTKADLVLPEVTEP